MGLLDILPCQIYLPKKVGYLYEFELLEYRSDLPLDSFKTVRVFGQILDDHTHLVIEDQVRPEVSAFFVEKVAQTSRYTLKIDHDSVDVLFVVFDVLVQSLERVLPLGCQGKLLFDDL